MITYQTIWTNTRWTLVRVTSPFRSYLRIDDEQRGLSDYPIRYPHNLEVAYHQPEAIPSYVKNIIARHI